MTPSPLPNDKPPLSALRSANTAPVRILLALLLGIVGGINVADQAWATPTLPTVAAIGKLWLDALTMTVVSLVTSLLIAGVFDAGLSGGNAIARHAMLWFVGILIGASLLGSIIALGLLEYWPVPAQALKLTENVGAPPAIAGDGWLDGIIPTNVVRAAADGAIVPLVLFALLFGFALTRIERKIGTAVARHFPDTWQCYRGSCSGMPG